MWAETYNSCLNMMSCKARNLQEARVLSGIRKVMVDNKTNRSSYYISIAKRANEILRYLNRRLSIRKDTLPLYLAIMQLQLQSFLEVYKAFWRFTKLARIQSRSMRLLKRLENVHYSERFRELNLFILTARRELVIVCKHLKRKRLLKRILSTLISIIR